MNSPTPNRSQANHLFAKASLTVKNQNPLKRMSVNVRFALRSPKKGKSYSNPHPLQVWITVNRERFHLGAVWNNERLLVDPATWRLDEQRTSKRGDVVNTHITSLKAYIESVFWKQTELGGIPTAESVRYEFARGYSPEWSDLTGWILRGVAKRKGSPFSLESLSADSPLEVAYAIYIDQLRGQGNLSPITLGRWDRGLFLLNTFADETGQPLPLAGKVTIGWAKRFHAWMQTQSGGRHGLQPISEGQASRFIHKVSAVLTWMLEEGWITSNVISQKSWPRYEDKEVQFLEPEQVHQLMQLDWKGTKGGALWWFLLMCCTGMDYPDALQYAQNRKAYEVDGRAGRKIVGKRLKPPHVEYNLPLLDEVDRLFSVYPTGPARFASQVVNRYTDQIEEELGIKWRITAKTARKTFGCLMLAAGHRISDVSLMLGHSNIQTTERHYVKVRGASIDRSMERVQVSIVGLVQKGGQADV